MIIDKIKTVLDECVERFNLLAERDQQKLLDMVARDNATQLAAQLEENNVLSMLELSTAHIRQSTAEKLDSDWSAKLIMSKWMEYGWIIYASSSLPPDTPPDLALLLNKANALGAEYLKLDRDGDINDSLPTYEW